MSTLSYLHYADFTCRSSVINSLEGHPREGEILLFFYFDFRDERFTSSSEALRSILSQLLRQSSGDTDAFRYLADNLAKAKRRGGAVLKSAKQLAEILSRAAQLLNRQLLVIMDALDECKDIRELIQALMVMKGRVRLFVTSRPLRVIMGDLSCLPSVSMDDMVADLSADIELHVTRELDARHRLRDLDAGFKAEIRTVLCDKADGMYELFFYAE